MSSIAIISGSPSPSSRLNGVLNHIHTELAKQDSIEVEWVRVHQLPPEDLVYTKFDSPSIVEANRIIQRADGIIVATPIYKASYTGVLKAFLDLIPQKGLEGKVVLPLAIGGSLAHLLAIDYALKPVLSALGARNQLQGVYALDTQVKRLDEGGFEVEVELQQRLTLSAADFAGEVKQLADRKTKQAAPADLG